VVTQTVLRTMTSDDATAVRDLHHLALQAIGSDAGPGPWDDDLDHAPESYLRAGGTFLVLEEDGALIAMGALRRLDRDRAEIKRMRVRPDRQGRGHGRRMLAALERRARDIGCTRLVLDTTAGQSAALGLYTGAGYRQTGTAVIAGLPALLFEKDLTAG